VTFYIDATQIVVLLSELDDGSPETIKLVALDGYDTNNILIEYSYKLYCIANKRNHRLLTRS
jgi:hypothetical protein